MGRRQRRASPEQCPRHESAGRRDWGAGPRSDERSSPRWGSETVEGTSIRRKVALVAGRRWKRILAEPRAARGFSRPTVRPVRRPGCSRELRRGGALTSVSPSLSCPRPTQGAASVARLCCSSPPSLRRLRREEPVDAKGEAAVSPYRTRVGRSSGVLTHRKRCRSRWAALVQRNVQSVTSNRTPIHADGA